MSDEMRQAFEALYFAEYGHPPGVDPAAHIGWNAFQAGAAWQRRAPVPPRTPKDIVDRLGVQQGSRVHASLVGDKQTQRAAEHWLGLIALDHWHEIIADLRAMYDAAGAAK